MVELVLERRAQEDTTAILAGGAVMLTPAIDEDYWEYRVRLTKTQSVVGFPKFMTIGVGFAVEDYDWNTNLPYLNYTAEKIAEHIWKNRGSKSITRAMVIDAVQMIREAAAEDRGTTADLAPKMGGMEW